MAGTSTKIDVAWEKLFDKYNILARVNSNGTFRISSTLINEFHEARLMAKFDQSSQLPAIFHKNQLSILPVTRGDYLIGPFETHLKVCYSSTIKPQPVEAPALESLDPQNLYSEASAVLFAYNSGIIRDIMGSDEVKFTVNGRMRSDFFSFSVNNNSKPQVPIDIDVQNSQIEIDAGFESPDAFIVCEVKNQAPEELLIRQLYYPYRLWKGKIAKPVIPVFLAFSNDVFHVFKYSFEDEKNYNSINLEKYQTYTFADEDISSQDIMRLWQTTQMSLSPGVPLPQADSFPRIFDLLSVLHEEDLTRSEVTLKYEFVARQTNYYISACEYLGLIERFKGDGGERAYRLTQEAREIMVSSYKKKHLMIIKKIFERPVFHKAFEFFAKNNRLPSTQDIEHIMKSIPYSRKINDTTIERRSSTVLGWLKWIVALSN